MKKKSFSSSAEVFSWISNFINLERGQRPRSFRLERMEFLTESAGNPHTCAPSIHIAGSKGKGSVTAMTAAILTEAGFKTARYMSPHVSDIRERICFGSSYFSEDTYCSAGDDLRELVEEQLPALIGKASKIIFDPAAPKGFEPTFWELMTLLFFLCAKIENCDVMVVETGMGGRLDSTNILDPLVSVITLIELEHTSFLGNTIKEVAGEKAGIIKEGKPLILARQRAEALEVFRKTALEKNSPLFYLPEITEISGIKVHSGGTEFHIKNESTEFFVPIPGKVQAENAALAITAVKTAFPQINSKAIRCGLLNLSVPARFEKISGKAGFPEMPPFIIDGAHTPESLTLCIETFCQLYGNGGVLIFGCAADKDAAAMAKIASPHFTKIIITTPGTFKISNPALVYEAFADFAGLDKTIFTPDTKQAIGQALDFALPILGAGSFYLVSEIRKFFTS